MKYCKGLLLVLVTLLFPLCVSGEEISNYAGCDACHGAIHLTVSETSDLMGIEGMVAIQKLPADNDKMLKIDLDGKLKNGTKETPDDGYEIKIWGSQVFYIKNLKDQSFIQVITSEEQAPGSQDTQRFQPHIYLGAGSDNEILLEDSIEAAWDKLKYSQIYQWVGKTENKKEWLALLRGKIFQAMALVSLAE